MERYQGLFQNHPQRYEKLICFQSYTATTNEKFVGSSGIWTRTFGFLDRRSTHWAIESTGIGGESYPIKRQALSRGENISST